MNSTFFKQIQQLDFTGSLQLNISKGTENKLIVSVLLHNTACGDKAKNLIPPLTFNATADEYDEGFFQQITQPVKQISSLMIDMEVFLKQLEIAKKQSAMEKSKTEKVKKELNSQENKFNDAMALADKLEKEGKFSEAWIKLPDPSAFPDFAETIRKRKHALSEKFAPDLFGNCADDKPKQAEPISNHDPNPAQEQNSNGTLQLQEAYKNPEQDETTVYDDDPDLDDEYAGFDENEDNYEPF